MQLSTRQLLSAARARVIEREPYMSVAVMALVPREKPGMCEGKGWGVRGLVAPFAVTDRWIMYYDPDVLTHWQATNNNTEEVCEWVAACLAHELGHPIRDHAARCKAGAFHPRKWNRAADLEINDDLIAAGYKFPPGFGITPATTEDADGNILQDGKTAEQYYHEDPWRPGDSEDGMCAGGSGAGDPHDDESEDDEDARSQQDTSNIKKETAKKIQNYAAQRGRGEVPAGWERWADGELEPPVISWEDKLTATIGTAVEHVSGMVDRTMGKVYRRQAALGYGPNCAILPGWHAPKPHIVVVIDTSGSMGDDELKRAASETAGILESMHCEVTLMTNDADVNGVVTKITQVSDIKLVGGGGTDFRPPFEYIRDQMEPRPGVCIFVTDGVGPAHQDNPLPDMHTIWLGVGPYRQRPWGAAPDDKGYNPTGPIEWGEYIEVDETEKHGGPGYYGEAHGGSLGSGESDDDDDE